MRRRQSIRRWDRFRRGHEVHWHLIALGFRLTAKVSRHFLERLDQVAAAWSMIRMGATTMRRLPPPFALQSKCERGGWTWTPLIL